MISEGVGLLVGGPATLGNSPSPAAVMVVAASAAVVTPAAAVALMATAAVSVAVMSVSSAVAVLVKASASGIPPVGVPATLGNSPSLGVESGGYFSRLVRTSGSGVPPVGAPATLGSSPSPVAELPCGSSPLAVMAAAGGNPLFMQFCDGFLPAARSGGSFSWPMITS